MHLALATMRILEFLTVSFNLPDFGYFGGCHFLQRSMNPVDPSGPSGVTSGLVDGAMGVSRASFQLEAGV